MHALTDFGDAAVGLPLSAVMLVWLLGLRAQSGGIVGRRGKSLYRRDRAPEDSSLHLFPFPTSSARAATRHCGRRTRMATRHRPCCGCGPHSRHRRVSPCTQCAQCARSRYRRLDRHRDAGAICQPIPAPAIRGTIAAAAYPVGDCRHHASPRARAPRPGLPARYQPLSLSCWQRLRSRAITSRPVLKHGSPKTLDQGS